MKEENNRIHGIIGAGNGTGIKFGFGVYLTESETPSTSWLREVSRHTPSCALDGKLQQKETVSEKSILPKLKTVEKKSINKKPNT